MEFSIPRMINYSIMTKRISIILLSRHGQVELDGYDIQRIVKKWQQRIASSIHYAVMKNC